MSSLLASCHRDGWFWFWPLIPLFWLIVIAFCFRFFWRGPWRGRGGWHGYPRSEPRDPRSILADRYARGEIDHDEYRERLSNLDG